MNNIKNQPPARFYKKDLFLSKDVTKLQQVNENGQSDEIPQWKKEIYKIRESKQTPDENTNNNDTAERSTNEKTDEDIYDPFWKREIIDRKNEKLRNSNDPIFLRKNQINSIQNQLKTTEHPIWRKELLRKKITKLQNEIEEFS